MQTARLLLLVTAIVAAAAGCSRHEYDLRMVAPRIPVDRIIAEDIVRVLNERSSISIEMIEPDPNGDQTGIQALLADVADIALVSNNEPFAAGISTIMPMYANVLHVLVKRSIDEGNDAERPSADDLLRIFTSGRVYAGPPGAPSRIMLRDFAIEKGVPENAINFIDAIESSDCPDVFALFIPVLRDMESRIEGCEDGHLYLLRGLDKPESLGTGSSVEAATLLNPSLRAFVIPAGLYGEQLTPHSTVTLAVDKMLVSREDVAPAAVYDLISEVLRLRPALAAKEPTLFHGLSDQFSSLDSTFVLHPGAQSYVMRDEPSVYERYSGIAEVAVTLFVAAFSGLFAAVRIYNIRRKNRIDVFYSEAIRIRTGINDRSSASDRKAAITEVRMLQTRAFDMLVGEKLAADESFRIFITLSNDIIRELGQPSAPDWSNSA